MTSRRRRIIVGCIVVGLCGVYLIHYLFGLMLGDRFISATGRIVDEDGRALDGVEIRCDASKSPIWVPGTLSDISRGSMVKIETVNREFAFRYRGGSMLLYFHKAGYFREEFFVFGAHDGGASEASRIAQLGWTVKGSGRTSDVTVILRKMPGRTKLARTHAQLEISDGIPRCEAIIRMEPGTLRYRLDNHRLSPDSSVGSPGEPKHAVVLQARVDANGKLIVKGPDDPDGPPRSAWGMAYLDGLELRMTDPGDGFVRVDIPEPEKPYKWMRQAPLEGYRQSLTFPQKTQSDDSTLFYVRLGGRYGIAWICGGNFARLHPSSPNAVVSVIIQIELQPQGRDMLLPDDDSADW